jgi:ferredoxin-NADP reductase
MASDFKASFLEKRDVVPGIKTFVFRPEKKIEFKAGQYAFFGFELDGKRFRKHFTISCVPGSRDIEFTTIVSDSGYKQALDSLKEGHEAEVSRPMGEFTLDSRKSDKVAFLVGGIGVTPVKSILEDLKNRKEKGLEVFVFYSNRSEERIAFRKELEELAKALGFVEIVHTLTDLDGEQQKNWMGETGFIDRRMVKRHLVSEEEFCFFVVGPPSFNEAMEKMLKGDLAIPEEKILKENFSGY